MRTRRLLTKTSGKVHILSEAGAHAYVNSDDCEPLFLDFVQDFGRTVSVLGADGEEHFVQVHWDVRAYARPGESVCEEEEESIFLP